jgi:GT2 family glycosyltransferase
LTASVKSGAATPGPPLVSVVVVNYNGGERLTRCVQSLLTDAYPAQEVLVVDNASTDGSLDGLAKLATTGHALTIVRSDRNLGYAGGVDLALPRTRGTYLAALNMDLEVTPGWLQPLVEFLETHPEVGAVNPLITIADGSGVNAAGQDIHVTGLGFNRWLGRRLNDVPRAPTRVSGLHGAAFLIRRSLLERIGGMDSSGFLYHEDVNLSWLVRLAGVDLYCVPASLVRHDYFLSMYPDKLSLLERNRWALLLAYLHWRTLFCLAPALLITECMLWGYCLLGGRAFVRAKLLSYAWVWRQRRAIEHRRRVARSVRAVSDWHVLRRLRWTYVWDQCAALGRTRDRSLRQPPGGLPISAPNA